jgi:hypothetical protein
MGAVFLLVASALSLGQVPAEAVARTRVLAQPGSPLVVRRVDVSDLHLSFGGPWVDTAGSWTVVVQNVSDQVIHDAYVRIMIGNARGHYGGQATTLCTPRATSRQALEHPSVDAPRGRAAAASAQRAAPASRVPSPESRVPNPVSSCF